MKAWTLAISSMMLTASVLSFASYFVSDRNESAAMLTCSIGLILIGLVLAVVIKIRQTKPRRPDLDH